MRWKRRKSLWPLLGALVCLFGLAVAAPLSWQGTTSKSLPAIQDTVPQADLLKVVVLQPQSGLDGQDFKTRPVLPPRQNTCPVPKDLVLVAPRLSPEPLPVQQNFDVDTLLQMRNALLSILGRLQEPLQDPSPLTYFDRSTVRVSSPDDRLAMLPRRRRSAVPVTQVPEKLVASSPKASASDLLQAARTPQTEPSAVPRLAMRNDIAAKSEAEVERQIQPAAGLRAVLRTQPVNLIEQLDVVANKPSQTEWAFQAVKLIEQLADQNSSIEPIKLQQILAALDHHADAGIENSNPILEPEAIRAALALKRRLGVWHVLLSEAPSATAMTTDRSTTYSRALMPMLGELASLLAGEANGAKWRDYLLLDRLAASTSEGLASDSQGRIQLAQEVLSRMDDARLTDSQREFLSTRPLNDLRRQLQQLAAGPVDLERLDALIERYESEGGAHYAAAIAQLGQRLQWSPDVRWQALAEQLDEHYRGANLRIAISDDLMNRMIPKQNAIISPVRENVAGAKVRGKSRTTTTVRVRLLPDTETWRFALEAFGKVYSETRSETWPARVQNAAKMQFQARKLIVIDQEGMRTSPTKAQAQGRNELLGVDSQLDPIPLVGRLLRSAARQKHHKSRPTALRQVKEKVAQHARQRMDKETKPKLARLEKKFRDSVLAPLSQLALLAEPLDMHTTANRAVMNVRLANRGQLAAHTPRPFAPADSLVSMQMHETALNNAIAGLRLDGQRMTVTELFEFFSEKLGNSTAVPPADMPGLAVIEFAARGAVRIKCDGDRIQLVLGIHELAKGRDKIKSFEVHAFFRPVMKGLEVRLVRDGSLQFAGRRLKTGPRVVLHSVIGKLLPKDQEIGLLRADLENDPRLAGLMVTQLEIENGWIALALGQAHPKRVSQRAPELRLLSTPFVR